MVHSPRSAPLSPRCRICCCHHEGSCRAFDRPHLAHARNREKRAFAGRAGHSRPQTLGRQASEACPPVTPGRAFQPRRLAPRRLESGPRHPRLWMAMDHNVGPHVTEKPKYFRCLVLSHPDTSGRAGGISTNPMRILRVRNVHKSGKPNETRGLAAPRTGHRTGRAVRNRSGRVRKRAPMSGRSADPAPRFALTPAAARRAAPPARAPAGRGRAPRPRVTRSLRSRGPTVLQLPPRSPCRR